MTVRIPQRRVASLKPIPVAGLSLVAIGGLMLTACGAGATTNGSPSTGGHTSSGAQQANTGGGGAGVADGIGHSVNVCALLPATTVASVSGEPIMQAQEDDTPSYKQYDCNYTSADGTSGLDVGVEGLDAAAGYAGSLEASGGNAKQISGLGDKAYSDITGLHALFGNVSITVSNLRSDTDAETLIRDLQPKL